MSAMLPAVIEILGAIREAAHWLKGLFRRRASVYADLGGPRRLWGVLAFLQEVEVGASAPDTGAIRLDFRIVNASRRHYKLNRVRIDYLQVNSNGMVNGPLSVDALGRAEPWQIGSGSAIVPLAPAAIRDLVRVVRPAGYARTCPLVNMQGRGTLVLQAGKHTQEVEASLSWSHAFCQISIPE